MKFACNIKLSTYRKLIRAGLTVKRIRRKDFRGASFDGARFDGARFDGASFDGASFDRASFDRASFDRARFDGASFYGARFDRARFDGARFYGANFDGASFDGASLHVYGIGISIDLYGYRITIIGRMVQVGCEKRNIKEWENLAKTKKGRDAIRGMEEDAEEYIKIVKEAIKYYRKARKLIK